MSEETVCNDSQLSQQSPQTLTELIVIRPDSETLNRSSLPNFVGISANTVGAKAIAMYLTIIPPGAIAEPHLHPEHETGIYLLKGRVELRYGEGLSQCQICEAGDFIFTPPGIPHQPRNLSATEPVYVLAARNDADEVEKVVPYNLEKEKSVSE
ncbi:cupin domain-containing protein [Calothrix sp. 336/3]|uniref:cupin domain-containing protein n=1 Tax=Calothrix sp. 336/3 TaxID=1337936 RepID=UPI0004E3F8F0|nr:cupin domain-containing protein [Calothrix sp. 336/3]AKG21564.1 cupin [Calothrix sp. 336/3]